MAKDTPTLAQVVEDRWAKAKRATSRERQRASENRQFVRNSNQWVFHNEVTNRLEEWRRDRGRARATVDRIGPDSRGIIAKLIRRPLAFEVPPTTPDDAATYGARIGEAALATAHQVQNWERLRERHLWAVWEAGVAGIVVEWDGEAGVDLGDHDGKSVSTGEVRLDVVSIHEIGTVPGTRDVEHARWWIHAQALPPEEVKDRYGLEDEPVANAHAVDDVYGANDTDFGATPLTIVLRQFERPGSWGKGGVTTVVAGQVIEQTPWPFSFKDHLNLFTSTVIPKHNSWLGGTPVTSAVPMQVLYNSTWSNIIEHLKHAGNARGMLPMGAVDDVEEWTDQPGEWSEYNPINGEKPYYLSPPTQPEWWSRLPEQIALAIDDALNRHDVSRGESPAGIESGVGLSVLLEADDTPTGAMGKAAGEMWGRVASAVLKCWEAKVTETRDAKVYLTGTNIPEMVQWRGGDLAGQTTAIVPTDAVIPRSRAAQAAFALQLFDRQVITTPEQLARLADLPDQDDMLEGLNPDAARARRENHYMAVGRACVVDKIDNDAAHLVIHRDFMRSARFENLPVTSQMQYVKHLQAHEHSAAEKAANQTLAAQASPVAGMLPTAETQTLDPMMVNQAVQAQEAQEMQMAAQTAVPQEGPPQEAPIQ